jgi:hypothetical protein
LKRVKARIAHIKGEHPGSARFDEKQPDSERQGIENLMLLCPNHHTLIDDLRPDDFPVDRLVEMRARHLAASVGATWCSDQDALMRYAIDAIIISGYSVPSEVPVEEEHRASAEGHIEFGSGNAAASFSPPAEGHIEFGSGNAAASFPPPAEGHIEFGSGNAAAPSPPSGGDLDITGSAR